ncbi:STAS domain-containing protein [Actinomadura fibrosa]|uniref:STAS domain-containing protein n=1 Tax=Actinomadura fibrosa TaxID=111802 RepID=A0ABW2XQE2_9ACTN|nr:STAS domain-containing protein [Actinomadura fibrosa]
MLVQPNAPQFTSRPIPPTSGGTAPGTAPDRTSEHRTPGGLVVETRSEGPFTVLEMTGRLEADTVPTAEARVLTTVVLASGPLHLALDLTGIEAVDTAGANLLTKAGFAVRAARGTFHLIVPDFAPARAAVARHLLGNVVRHRRELTLPATDTHRAYSAAL